MGNYVDFVGTKVVCTIPLRFWW